MQPEVERRTVPGGFEIRATEGGKKLLTGYAAKFNVLSEDLGFREKILPGAFDRALREQHDVRALVNHNPDKMLGRTDRNLALSVDEIGLRMEMTPLSTATWEEALANVEAGLWTQMSFAFRVLGDEWKTVEGEVVREVSDLELYDVSIVTYPAYSETEVQISKRALEQARAAKPPALEPASDAVREKPPESAPPPEPGIPLEILRAQNDLEME